MYNHNNCVANIGIREIKRELRYNNVVVLKLTIKYPVIRIPFNQFAENQINNQINCQISEYVKYVTSTLYFQAIEYYNESQANDYPFFGYEAIMDYNITYNDNCFLSLYVDKYEFTGGAHGSTMRSSSTWELCQGTHIPLFLLFRPDTNIRQFITDEAIKEANANISENPIYFENYQDLIVQNFHPENFYLTSDGLAIYYQQYDIAPYSTGIVVFTIPYEIIGWYPSC